MKDKGDGEDRQVVRRLGSTICMSEITISSPGLVPSPLPPTQTSTEGETPLKGECPEGDSFIPAAGESRLPPPAGDDDDDDGEAPRPR